MNKIPVKFHIDTGADKTILSKATCHRINAKVKRTPELELRLADGNKANVYGTSEIIINLGNERLKAEVLVTEHLPRQCLLGRDILDASKQTRAAMEQLRTVATISTAIAMNKLDSRDTGDKSKKSISSESETSQEDDEKLTRLSNESTQTSETNITDSENEIESGSESTEKSGYDASESDRDTSDSDESQPKAVSE